MKYTKQQRKHLMEAFRSARIRIELEIDNLICVAISESNVEFGNEARLVVQSRIKPYCALDSWVAKNCRGGKSGSMDEKQMRIYRLRWLDALIKEFSE